MAWSKDVWCVVSAIKINEGSPPVGVLSIHPTKLDAEAIMRNLTKNDRWPTTARLMKYTRYIRDLKKGDVVCCQKIDIVLNYLERDRDAIREEV